MGLMAPGRLLFTRYFSAWHLQGGFAAVRFLLGESLGIQSPNVRWWLGWKKITSETQGLYGSFLVGHFFSLKPSTATESIQAGLEAVPVKEEAAASTDGGRWRSWWCAVCFAVTKAWEVKRIQKDYRSIWLEMSWHCIYLYHPKFHKIPMNVLDMVNLRTTSIDVDTWPLAARAPQRGWHGWQRRWWR